MIIVGFGLGLLFGLFLFTEREEGWYSMADAYEGKLGKDDAD